MVSVSPAVGIEWLVSDATVHAFLSSVSPVAVPLGYATSVRLALSTTFLLCALELLSLPVALTLLRQRPALYAKGWAATTFNNFVIGPFMGLIAFELLCVKQPLDPWARLRATLGVLIVHAVGYYITHRAMHTKALYWAHSFHHQFNAHVVPSAANAVSFTEYCLAYMIPFIVAALLFKPDAPALVSAISVVSGCNLFIHTPTLERLAAATLPSIVVGPHGHIDHHRKLTKNYSAPTVNIDALLVASPTLSRLADRFFFALGGKAVAVSSGQGAKAA